MSRFFETIKIEEGLICQLQHHQQRFDKTRLDHYDDRLPVILEKEIIVPAELGKGTVRCRLDYSETIDNITFSPYLLSEHCLVKLVDAAAFDYTYKYTDRSFFSLCLQENETCDDVLFTRHGFLTDATYSNLILFKDGTWFTPKTYLLKGTKRTALLAEGKIKETDIHSDDLIHFEKIAFINAMRDFEKTYTFTIDSDFLILNSAES